jgi:hypothetical protein
VAVVMAGEEEDAAAAGAEAEAEDAGDKRKEL